MQHRHSYPKRSAKRWGSRVARAIRVAPEWKPIHIGATLDMSPYRLIVTHQHVWEVYTRGLLIAKGRERCEDSAKRAALTAVTLRLH